METAVIELNGAAVLHAAMESLHFAVALDGLGNPGRGNGKREDEKRQKKDGCKQDVAFFGGANGALSGGAANWG